MRLCGGRRLAVSFKATTALFGVVAPVAAVAQPVANPATAAPPKPFEQAPAPAPFVVPEQQQSAPAPLESSDAARIARVRVLADGSGSDAVPPAGWTPPVDGVGSVQLVHRPGQPLDAVWVQEQFDRISGSGALRPSTAIALVQLINRAFVSAGFVNSGLLVAGQADAAGAVLDLRLVYGRLASADTSSPVAVEWGDKRSGGLSASYVRNRFPSLRGQPLSAYQLERDFRLLDESPEIRSISAALRPGQSPGEASLHLVVHPADRFDLYMGASNDRSPSVGGERAFAGGQVRNLLASGDLLSGEAGMTRGVEDAQLSYSTPFLVPPLSLSLRGSFNNAAVITSALAPLDIRAKDRSAEVGLAYRVRQEPLMVRAGSDRWSASESISAGIYLLHREQRSYLLGLPFSFAPGSVDGRSEFGAVRLAGDYVRRDLSRVIVASVGATLGIDGTRSDVPGIPNPRRSFAAVLGQLNFAQRVGSGFELRGRLAAQHSRGTLYSGLRLAIGGASTVRGYRENLFLVDRGVIGSVELAHNFSLSGEQRRGGADWGQFTASIFTDGAWFRNAEPPQSEVKSIGSLGAALAWTPSPGFQASIAYGHALRDVPTPGKKSLQDRGIHFRVLVDPLGIF